MRTDDLPLPDRLIWLVDIFRKTMAPEACKRGIGLFGLAIWQRVKGFERRFCKLYAMWKAGTLPVVRARVGRHESARGGLRPPYGAFDPAACDGASMERARLRPVSVLPRGFAWMRKLVPMGAGTLACGLSTLLNNYPETRELVAACPEAGRILRPFCRMVGLKPPEWLALPKRKNGASARPSPQGGEGEGKKAAGLSAADEEKLRRITARFPDTPPARSAKRVWRRMFEGRPVNLKRLSAVALGYVLHPPRDGNCPPPEIGYGGRSFPPLPKDYVWPKD